MSIKTTDIQPNEAGFFPCPECANTDKPVAFNDRGHLGLHRRIHGIMGTTSTYKKAGSRLPHPNKLAPDKVARIMELHNKGMSASLIKAQTGISESSVFKYIRENSHKKVGRPPGSKNARRAPYKLRQPIVERVMEKINSLDQDTRQPSITLIDRIRDLETKVRDIQKAIGME